MFFKRLWSGCIGFLIGMAAMEITYYVLTYNNRLDIMPWICVCTGCVLFLIVLIWALVAKHKREKAHPKPKPQPAQQTENFAAAQPAAEPAPKHKFGHKNKTEAAPAPEATAAQTPMPEATNVQSATDFLADNDTAASAKPVEDSALADKDSQTK